MSFDLFDYSHDSNPNPTSSPPPAPHHPQTVNLEVSNPFEASAQNAADGRFTVRLKQAVISEHPAIASLAPSGAAGAGGRRGSTAAIAAAARRRSSSVPLSSVLSNSAASAPSGGGKKSREGGGGGRRGPDVGAGAGGEDMNVS